MRPYVRSGKDNRRAGCNEFECLDGAVAHASRHRRFLDAVKQLFDCPQHACNDDRHRPCRETLNWSAQLRGGNPPFRATIAVFLGSDHDKGIVLTYGDAMPVSPSAQPNAQTVAGTRAPSMRYCISKKTTAHRPELASSFCRECSNRARLDRCRNHSIDIAAGPLRGVCDLPQSRTRRCCDSVLRAIRPL